MTTVLPRPMRTGEIAKQHYADEKLGACAWLAPIDPLTGRRLEQVPPQRTKREFTLFCQALAAQYQHATYFYRNANNPGNQSQGCIT